MKNIIKKILGGHAIEKILMWRSSMFNYFYLFSNFYGDLLLYFRHSNVFKIDNRKKIETNIILDYHSIEKGLLFENTKGRFARERVLRLHMNLSKDSIVRGFKNSQILVAYKLLCQYYEIHQELSININDFFSVEQYETYRDIISDNYSGRFSGYIQFTKESFYKNAHENFELFSNSRKSIRDFTGEKVDLTHIKNAVKLANNSPSVCNRQSSKVYLLEDKGMIDQVLTVQGGFTGYTENVVQLLIVTVNRNYFYTIGERNQFYIDGGLFLMNLLYALHYHKIAACPANWGKRIEEEKYLETIIKIPKAEKIICMLPIGVAKEEFRVTLSQRRNLEEIFEILN